MVVHKARKDKIWGWAVEFCSNSVHVNPKKIAKLSKVWRNVTCKRCLKLKGGG